MKKRLKHYILLLIFLLSVTACERKPNEITESSSHVTTVSGHVSTELIEVLNEKRTLTMSDRFVRPALRTAIERFCAAYPSVEIVVNNYDGDYEAFELQTYTKLMAGDADDIIRALGFSDMKLFDSGLLADFYPLMQNDLSFKKDDYFLNVFKGSEYHGKLYTFPINFMYEVIGINNSFSGGLAAQFHQYSTVSYRQMLDLYDGLTDKGGRCVQKDMSALYTIIESLNMYIDYENKTCDFNNDSFIRFIIDMKNAGIPMTIDEYESASFTEAEMEEEAQQYLFRSTNPTRNALSVFFPYIDEKAYSHYIPLVDEKGNLMFGSEYSLCISEASENKELAWEFIKFLTTEEANQGQNLSPCFPVHKKFYNTSVFAGVTASVENLELIGTINGEAGEVVTSVMNTLASYHEMPMIWIQTPASVVDIILESLTNFYMGTQTAEQVASALQNKMLLYLMEMM